jgi:hypothetical protein
MFQTTYTGGEEFLVALVNKPDHSAIWNWATAQWIPVTPELDLTPFLLTLMPTVGNPSLRWGTFPVDIEEAGEYPISIYELTGDPPVGISNLVAVDTIVYRWDGASAVSAVAQNRSLSSVLEADSYFADRLYTDQWFKLTANKKQQALNLATQIINTFNFIGTKIDSVNEWPRSGVYLNNLLLPSTSIPQDILFAQYEIALALAKGIDPEREIRNLRVTSRGYSSVRTTYDPRLAPEHLAYGVPSALAWSYLSAYFNRSLSGVVRIHRVN